MHFLDVMNKNMTVSSLRKVSRKRLARVVRRGIKRVKEVLKPVTRREAAWMGGIAGLSSGVGLGAIAQDEAIRGKLRRKDVDLTELLSSDNMPRIQSRGKGQGLAYGRGRGPIGTPRGAKKLPSKKEMARLRARASKLTGKKVTGDMPRLRSKGQGRGLGYGRGKGPIGTSVGAKASPSRREMGRLRARARRLTGE